MSDWWSKDVGEPLQHLGGDSISAFTVRVLQGGDDVEDITVANSGEAELSNLFVLEIVSHELSTFLN